jgi:hypothetical protein
MFDAAIVTTVATSTNAKRLNPNLNPLNLNQPQPQPTYPDVCASIDLETPTKNTKPQ